MVGKNCNKPLQQLAANPNISLYYGQIVGNPQFKVLGLRNYQHTVLVNKYGTVVFNNKWDEYDKTFEDLDQTKAERPISAEMLKILQGLTTNETARKVKEALTSWDYPARFTVTYKCKYLVGKPKQKHGSQLVVGVAVREQHKAVAQPLIDLLEQEAELREEYIKIVQLPVGDKCFDCSDQLKFPYYYYHWSKQFRCRECGQRQDTQIGKSDSLKRYSVNENGVLLFKQSTVDEKRLGINLQPKTNKQCKATQFMCNGCYGGGDGQARYICMGCRREPNPRSYVDYCLDCVKVFAGPEGEKLTVLLDICEYRDKHFRDHPLLRMNYSPYGYQKF